MLHDVLVDENDMTSDELAWTSSSSGFTGRNEMGKITCSLRLNLLAPARVKAAAAEVKIRGKDC